MPPAPFPSERTTRPQTLLSAAAAAFVLAACADAPTAAVRIPTANLHIVPVAGPVLERFVLCKAGPVGTYTFSANATHPVLYYSVSGDYDLASASDSITVSALSTIDVGGTSVQGACATFDRGGSSHNHVGVAGGTTDASVITPSCAVTGSPSFKKGDDVRLEVIATLATGRVFSNSGFYKIP